MTALPIAAFLAGALLSLLLPTVLLIALVVWHWGIIARLPEPPEPTETPPTAAAESPPKAPSAQ